MSDWETAYPEFWEWLHEPGVQGRQRELTRRLGQPTCEYDHEYIFYWNPEHACRGCGAAL